MPGRHARRRAYCLGTTSASTPVRLSRIVRPCTRQKRLLCTRQLTIVKRHHA
jgi:hypothetical protein